MTDNIASDEETPIKVSTTGQRLVNLLTAATLIGHAIISVALIAAIAVIATHFFVEIFHAIKMGDLFSGFIQALATLLLLWTILELMQTEIGFLQGKPIDVVVFVQVALVVVVREIILLPVEVDHPSLQDVGKWAVTAALLGLTCLLLKYAVNRPGQENGETGIVQKKHRARITA